MGLFPKEVNFFELFDKASLNIIQAGGLTVELFKKFDNFEERSKSIYELEQEGDLITHEVMRRLNKTFLTPIDREDIHELCARLDDIVDLMWGAADRVHIFKVRTRRNGAIEMAESLHRNVETVHKAITNLKEKKYSYVQELCIEINRLENEADRIYRTSIVDLFETESDPIEIIKWMKVLEILEMATDKCEDVANVLESVAMKHG